MATVQGLEEGIVVDEFGTKRWWKNGKRHRVDGSAVMCANGHQLTSSLWIVDFPMPGGPVM